MFAFIVLVILGRLESGTLPAPRLCSGCSHPNAFHGDEGCDVGRCGCTEPKRYYGIA